MDTSVNLARRSLHKDGGAVAAADISPQVLQSIEPVRLRTQNLCRLMEDYGGDFDFGDRCWCAFAAACHNPSPELGKAKKIELPRSSVISQDPIPIAEIRLFRFTEHE